MNTYKTIYCHGWSSGPAVWEPLCGTPDVQSPGFRSAAGPDGFLDALKDSIPNEPHMVVGWSMGGMLAAEYAAGHPKGLKGLVLIGTTPRFVSSDRAKGWPAKIIEQMITRLQQSPEAVLREFQSGMFTPSERRALKSYRSAFSVLSDVDFTPESLIAGLRYLIETDLTAAVNAISCPVLWIHGTADAICPPGCLEGLPSGHHVTMVEGAGHVPHWSRPDEVRKLIREFTHDL